MRAALPNRRYSHNFNMRFWSQNWQVTIGFYNKPGTDEADPSAPGEVFINGGKSGVELEGVARDSAILFSLAIQHGVSLDTIRAAITRNGDNSPATIIGAIVDRVVNEIAPVAVRAEAAP